MSPHRHCWVVYYLVTLSWSQVSATHLQQYVVWHLILLWWNGIKVYYTLTYWGRVTHINVRNLTIIGSNNGLSHGRRLAIIWKNVGILLIGPLETNFHEILIEIHTFSFRKIYFKMSQGKWRPFCLGLNVLRIIRTSWQFVDYGSI